MGYERIALGVGGFSGASNSGVRNMDMNYDMQPYSEKSEMAVGLNSSASPTFIDMPTSMFTWMLDYVT